MFCSALKRWTYLYMTVTWQIYSIKNIRIFDVYEVLIENYVKRVTVEHHLKTIMDRVKRIWYLSPMRAAKVQASLCIRAVSPEPSLLAHTSSASRGTFRKKARSLAPLNGWACAVKICHDGMLEDTNSLDGALMDSCSCISFLWQFHLSLIMCYQFCWNT